MNSQEFREFGKAVIDYIADYHDNIRDRPVLPSVNPGYLRPMIPETMPDEPEAWQDIFKDLDRVIMPGLTHWQSPGFHAYYPTGASFPSIIGELMSAGTGVVGFSWVTSPACTELEMVMMDWLGKAMDLPSEFLNCSDSEGGGCLQGSASEATLLALLVSKDQAVRRVQRKHPEWSMQEIKAKLVCYGSDQSNSSVEKAGILASVPMRLLPTDDKGRLRGETVEKAVKADIKKGLIPCYLVANYGTTATCAFDELEEISPVCKEYDLWLHLDAAYAGIALVCPEMRHHMPGLHLVDSLVTNLHKWGMINFDCSAMWFKKCKSIIETFTIERIYLSHKPNCEAPDLRHWQIPLGRRFRALKVWFTLRTYGMAGLQGHIRNHVDLAKEFEKMVLADSRFEIASPTAMGLVCFRVKGDNKISSAIIDELNKRKKIYCIPGKLLDKINIRFVVASQQTTLDDIKNSFKEIVAATDIVMEQVKENEKTKRMLDEETSSITESVVKPMHGIQISTFVKQPQPETHAFCTPRHITNVARS